MKVLVTGEINRSMQKEFLVIMDLIAVASLAVVSMSIFGLGIGD
jgi:hypothetical protein